MKRVKFEVKTHEDRIKIYEVLAKNGYSVDIKTETKYLKPRVYICVDVEDHDVEGSR